MFVVRWFLGLGTRIKSILITAGLILILIFGTIFFGEEFIFQRKPVPKVAVPANVYCERIRGDE